MKIGFSKFCSMRPKWCVTSSSSGTHSVCVCSYNQNAVLLTNGANINENYKDLMARVKILVKIVFNCSVPSSGKNMNK